MKKSPKWQRHYIGPYLIVEEIPPCNFVLQQTARSKPFVTHVDKLKEFFGDPPAASWLVDDATPPPVVVDVLTAVPQPAQQHGMAAAPVETNTPVIQLERRRERDVKDDGRRVQTPPVRQLRARDQRRVPARYRQ